MITRVLLPLACLTVLATGQLAAQNTLLAESQPAKYTAPLCPLKPNNKSVEKALDLLKKSYDAKTPAEKTAMLGQAKQSLTASIVQEAQDKNAAAWYYLARVALLQGDARGADSAFTKAEALNATCEYDINTHRQNSWAAVANPGLEMLRANKMDTALSLFREANYLYRAMPHVYSYMGVAFANTDKPDSAAVYFATALKIAEADTALKEDRNTAALNLGLMYQRLGKHQDAMVTLRKYLGWNPSDTDARKALAVSFRSAGMEDSARAIENAMVEEFSKANLDSLDSQDLMAVGVAAFNAQRYAEAANAFKKAVDRNPWSRDARYNLANSYLAQKNHEALIAEATKLLEIEPLSEDVLRLLAQGQRGLKQDEAVVKTAERLVGLPFSVEVTGFQMSNSTAKLSGEATGRTALDPKGNPLKTAPVTLVFEFLDQSGKVVSTKETTVPVLKEGEKKPLEQEGSGAGITGWRYRIK
jgi:tetratricopeptide (TPR) repeat protein